MSSSLSSLVWADVGVGLVSFAATAMLVVLVARVQPRWRARAVVAAGVWLLLWALVAQSGALADFDRKPPPIVALMVGTLTMGTWLGCSRVGLALMQLPLSVLVGVQAFRLPLELFMHQLTPHGLPQAFTFGAGGFNYDIVTGIAALLLGVALHRVPAVKANARLWVALWLAVAWLALSVLLVLAIVTSPLVAAFGADQLNVWVTRFPDVYVPAVCVAFALALQIVTTRVLLQRGETPPIGRG